MLFPDMHPRARMQTPAIYTTTVLNVAARRGLEPAWLLREAGIDAALLSDPNGLIPSELHLLQALRVLELTGNDGLGFEIGLALPLTTHGNLGFALLCAGTLRTASELMQRFWQLRERATEVSLVEQGDHLVCRVSTRMQLPDPVMQVFFETLMTAMFRSIQLLLGTSERIGVLHLPWPEADYHARFRDCLPALCHDMPCCEYLLPMALLERPLPMANPDALRHAIAACEREQAMLLSPGRDLLLRVRDALVLSPSGYPDQEAVAAGLHVSLRTLRRRLQVAGTGYRELLEEARRRDALRLLETTALSVQDIAGRLGYLNPTNFSRAFRQWTGRTPRDYRSRRQG